MNYLAGGSWSCARAFWVLCDAVWGPMRSMAMVGSRCLREWSSRGAEILRYTRIGSMGDWRSFGSEVGRTGGGMRRRPCRRGRAARSFGGGRR